MRLLKAATLIMAVPVLFPALNGQNRMTVWAPVPVQPARVEPPHVLRGDVADPRPAKMGEMVCPTPVSATPIPPVVEPVMKGKVVAAP